MLYEWHKNRLSDKDRKAYEALLAGLERSQPVIAVPPASIQPADLMQKIICDHPELMYPDFRSFQYMNLFLRNSLHISYADPSPEADSLLAKWRLIFMESITPGMDDWDKASVIYDSLGSMVRYHEIDGLCEHTLRGVLLHHQAVCDGIAKMFKYLCDAAGLKCIVVQGTSRDQGHAWNIVCLDDIWYHLDLTADLLVADKTNGLLSHILFTADDKLIEKDHRWDRSAYPRCYDSTSWFDHYGMKTDSFLTFAKQVAAARKKGKASLSTRFVCSEPMTQARLMRWMTMVSLFQATRSVFLEESQTAILILK